VGKKRKLSKRQIKILALQRCSRAISLVVREGLFLPEDFPTYKNRVRGDYYPYETELDLECNEIAYRLRERLADLAVKEWPTIDRNIYNSSNDLNLSSSG
jgi:hypothetical protein